MLSWRCVSLCGELNFFLNLRSNFIDGWNYFAGHHAAASARSSVWCAASASLEMEIQETSPHPTLPDLSRLIYMEVMAPPPTEVEDVPRLSVPSRNPLPLSASQEAQVREMYHSRVRSYCAAEIKCSSSVPSIIIYSLDANCLTQYSPIAL